MTVALRTSIALGLCTLISVGCSDPKDPGHYWDVTLSGSAESCGLGAADYSAQLLYRVEYDDNDITVSVGNDVFATGRADGCTLTYTSVIWTEDRGDDRISWQLTGEAIAQFTSGSCGMTQEDWSGTETFEIVSSTDSNITPGCTYDLDLTGTYVEEIGSAQGDDSDEEVE